MAPHSSTLAWKSHGWRSLVDCSPWGREESDTTEQLPFHFSLLCIGEGNGNPLQCSCLENPRDGGAWWAAVYEVARSQTRLKRLSSNSLMKVNFICIFIFYLWTFIGCKEENQRISAFKQVERGVFVDLQFLLKPRVEYLLENQSLRLQLFDPLLFTLGQIGSFKKKMK